MRAPAAIGAALWVVLAAGACAPRFNTRGWEQALARPAGGQAGSGAGTNAGAPDAKDDPRLKTVTGEQPAQITSDRLDYTNQGRVSVFQGNVRVRQGATLLESPYLEVRSEDGQALARDGVRMIDHERGVTVTAQELEYRQSLANAKARGDVLLVSHDNQGEPLRMRSDRLAWDNARKQALAEGAVQVTYRGSTATASSMNFKQAEQIVELAGEGNTVSARPRIEQDGNTITGDSITLRLVEKTYEVTGKARADLIPRPPAASSNSRKEKP